MPTYSQFKATVQDYLIDSSPNLSKVLPKFIQFAQDEIARLVKFPYEEGEESFTATGDIYSIPADCLSLKSILVNGQSRHRLDAEAFADLTVNSRGTYFTQVNRVIKFFPALVPGDVVTVVYHKDFQRLTDDTDTNVALEKAEDLLLYLTLRHAAVYLRDTEQEQYWAQKASDASQTLSAQFDNAYWAGSTLKIRGIANGY